MKILLADDHPLILEGTSSFLISQGYEIVYKCSSGMSALKGIQLFQPDVAILDISMPEMSGLEVAKYVQQNQIDCKIVLLTMHKENNIYKKAVEYDVWGYILKNFSSNELVDCLDSLKLNVRYVSPNLQLGLVVNASMQSFEQLSATEKKVIELIYQKLNNKQIGEKLFISERTIEWHRRNIIDKLDLPKEKNSLLKWVLRRYQEDY